jgi:hypothetical protein
VADANAAVKLVVDRPDIGVEFVNAPTLFVNFEIAVEHGNARRIITAILEPLEPVDQNGVHLAVTDVAYDATHIRESKKSVEWVGVVVGRY